MKRTNFFYEDEKSKTIYKYVGFHNFKLVVTIQLLKMIDQKLKTPRRDRFASFVKR